MPHTLLFNRSDRARFEFSGAQIVNTLNGLVTNDVATLAPGQGQYAGILTPKSKILSDVRIFMLPHQNDNNQSPSDHKSIFLMDTSPSAAVGIKDFLRKYLNPRFAKYTDISVSTADFGIFGDRAREIVANATGIDFQALEGFLPYQHTVGAFQGTPVTIIRTPELGSEGYDLMITVEKAESFSATLQSSGATVSNHDTWRALRIAIGWPEWSVDMDDSTLPQEANFDELGALSHTKGCYIGHETIARIHFRGHVNKTLRRLVFSGPALPPAKADLLDDSGKSVGTITSSTAFPLPVDLFSSAAWPNGTTSVGIGMVRREIEDGTTLSVSWEGNPDPHFKAHIAGKAKGAVG